MPLQTQLNEDLNVGSRSAVLTLFPFLGWCFFSFLALLFLFEV